MNQPTELIKRVEETRQIEKTAETASSSVTSSYSLIGEDESTGHLRDYWRAVRKRLWVVIGLTLIITTLVAIYVARKPDVYEAQARVQVDLENNLGFGNSSKNGSVIVNSPVSDPTYFNTQLQILTGPGLLRRVVKTLDLEHNDAFIRPQSTQTRSTWQSLLRMFGLGGKDKAPDKDSAGEEIPLTAKVAPATSRDDLAEAKRLAPYVNALLASLKVEPVRETRTAINRDTRLIDIRFDHADPQVAARVVNAIADSFVRTNLEKKTETGNTTGDFLQKRIAELQSEIRSGEEQLSSYAKSKEILSLDDRQNIVVERLAGLNRQLLEAQNDRKLAEAAYHAALAPGAASALAETDAKQIAETESKLGDLRQKRAQLLVEATEEAPEVKEVNQQIGALERQIKDMSSHATSNILKNLETRYHSALAREESLSSDFNKQKSETITQNEAAINYRIIQQEIETNKSLLNGLLQSTKENEVVLAGTPNNIYVVDYSLVPDAPIGPPRMRILFLAFVFSLGAGVGFALFLEYIDDTIHSTDEAERLLSLPALAAIPAAGLMGRRRLRANAGALQSRNGSETTPELLLNADPRSPLAEAYRQLRTSVLLSTAGRAPKSLLVTSSLPGEGKTTTAVNTAISLAQTGANVVIIDADMRRPRLHTVFEIGNRKGLSTILSSEMTEAEMLTTIEAHEMSGLYLLPSGPIPPNPAELIGSEQMRRLIKTLEGTFTHIVVDSPPISSFTDGVLISSMVDGVLLVVQGGKSSRHVVRRSRGLLLDVGAKIFGIVLNNVKLHSQDYYYYQHYYNSSYYNRDAETDQLASDANS
jgi:succinoglycan biosynthesis transport protein ExoP